MKKLVLVQVFVLLTISFHVFAQDTNEASHSVTVNIPELALLDLEGGTSVTLTPTVPSEAGDAFDFSTSANSNVWLNYSSIVATGKTRSVTAAITSGSIPAGLVLKLTAAGYAGTGGDGTMGTSAGQITLSGTAQDIITGIESCYTGDGPGNGHQLTYRLELSSPDDYYRLVEGSTTLTVTYTLSEDN